MPTKDGRWTSSRARQTNRIKRYVLLAITMTALLATLDQWGFRSYAWLSGGQEGVSKSQRAEQGKGSISQRSNQERTTEAEENEPVAEQTTTVADCTFLQDPENFRNALARHRADVSATTEWVTRRLTPGQTTLERPEDPTSGRTIRAGETSRSTSTEQATANQATSSAQRAPGGNTQTGARPVGGRGTVQDIAQKTFIDTILFSRMQKDGVAWAPLCSDTEFIRRVTLDLTGRIPSPDEVNRFADDTNPYKRDVLVDSLIGTPEFVDKWTMFFGDLFKNTLNATNVIRYTGGRDAFYLYLKDAIATNKSYDQIAREMIATSGDSYVQGQVNFLVGGTVPMGPAQDTYDGQAVNTSTMFLGISSMDCLLCHNGAGHLTGVNLWGSQRTRSEAWGMSAFFARTNMARTAVAQPAGDFKYIVSERANGEYQLNTTTGNRSTRAGTPNTVAPKYMFGSGGGVNAGEDRRQALARLVTADPQFARAAVNYIWEKLMVEALVSPSNTFDPARLNSHAPPPAPWTLQPANPELLEALAQDFMRGGYNLQSLMRLITKSSIYQLSSQYPGTWKLDYVPYYARKYVRRLDAEEIHDAITKATGIGVSYSIDATLGNATWAMQLPEPAEPRSNGGARTFLNSFLRGDRDQAPRSNDSSILQSLNLMNNAFVMGRIHQNNANSTVSRLLAQNQTPTQIITNLYLSTLSRKPTQAELNALTPYFTSLGTQRAAESVQWVLLNKIDFVFNY